VTASLGLKLYLHFLDYYANTYGSIGAVVILMMWFYLFGIAILAGAEVNSEIEKASGTVKKIPMESVPSKTKSG
jgi:membrane protein